MSIDQVKKGRMKMLSTQERMAGGRLFDYPAHGSSIQSDVDLRMQMRESFNRPGIHANLYRVQQEKHRRLISYKRPNCITVDSDFCGDNRLPPLPSSLLLYSATKGSGLIPELQAAYETEDIARLKALGSDFKTEMRAAMRVLSSRTAVDEIVRSPVFFDVRYGAKGLACDMAMVNGLQISGIHFAWNGGALDESLFEIVEYLDSKEAEGYDYLLVARPPKLSAFEQEVLDAVPYDLSELHLSNEVACPYFCAAILLIYFLVTATGFACSSLEHELQAALKEMNFEGRASASATPRELLKLRREVFEKYRV